MHSGGTGGRGLMVQTSGKGKGGHLLLFLDGLDPFDEDLLFPVFIVAGCLLLWQHPQLLCATAASPGRGALVLQQRSSRFGQPLQVGGVSSYGWREDGMRSSREVSSAVDGWA